VKFLKRLFRRPLFYAGSFPDYSNTYPFVLGFGVVIIFLSVLIPINGYILVIMGLVIDIVGAGFIISPLLHQLERFHTLSFFARAHDDETFDNWRREDYLRDDQNKAKLGLSILILGFLIQILGNLYQYLNL